MGVSCGTFFLLLHSLPAVASLSRDIYFQEALFAGAGVGGPTMDLCPHGTGLTPRMEVRAMEEGRVWPKAPYGTHTRRVSAPARPITAPLAVWLLCWYQGGSHNRWQRGYFHQTGGVHRWYHFCGRLLP